MKWLDYLKVIGLVAYFSSHTAFAMMKEEENNPPNTFPSKVLPTALIEEKQEPSNSPTQKGQSIDFLTEKELKKPYIMWLHANNTSTIGILDNFTKELYGFVHVYEFHSVSSLNDQIEHLKHQAQFNAIVTEMGLWEDAAQTIFSKEAGLSIMELLAQAGIKFSSKFVISARVGRNEDNLLERSKRYGYAHTYRFDPIINSLASSKKDRQMYAVISKIQQSLKQKPYSHPPKYEKYPISNFKIERIYDIQSDKNIHNFKLKRSQLKSMEKPIDYEWLFHASHSKESTISIIRDNFDLKFLGTYSGNLGNFGRGIYFSTRAYLPIYIASVQEEPHYMFLVCKVLRGASKVVSLLSEEEKHSGRSVEGSFDSYISNNMLEVVIPDSLQILPCFLIQFSLTDVEDRGFWIWNQTNGKQKKIRNLYFDNQGMKEFQ